MQWDSEVIQTVFDVTVKSICIWHQFVYTDNLNAFKCQSSCHNKTNISGTKDDNSASRFEVFKVYITLCQSCGKYPCRTGSWNTNLSSCSLTASHSKDNRTCLKNKHSVFTHSNDMFIFCHIKYHCI